jgi:hypothetical protein
VNVAEALVAASTGNMKWTQLFIFPDRIGSCRRVADEGAEQQGLGRYPVCGQWQLVPKLNAVVFD